jgi:S1-C subfamily serine protease
MRGICIYKPRETRSNTQGRQGIMFIDKLKIINRNSNDNQIISMKKRNVVGRGIFLGLGLLLVLALVACTGSGLATATDSTASANVPSNTLAIGSTVDGGTAFPIGNMAIDELNASDIVAAQELVMGNIYEVSLPSVVQIRITQKLADTSASSGFNFFGGGAGETQGRYLRGEGSGFVWDIDGHILTNFHVVDEADTVTVVFYDGEEIEAIVLGGDPDSDLAILKVDVPGRNLQPLPQGDTKNLRVGQIALAIGNPFGQNFTLTSGIVSALGRSISSGNSLFSIPQAIQTDAPINPGNSGGPLLDRQGQVIGINTQIITQGGIGSSGIGFAVPINIAKRVVPELIAHGKYEYSWLGISGISTSAEVVSRMGLPDGTRGVEVVAVAENSPASDAGLQGSDRDVTVDGLDFPLGGDVIVGINGAGIRRMDDLVAYLVANTSPGDMVILDIIREGGETDVLEVTLGSRPHD